ncbi:hypothetical protein GCM10009682_20160 [Luedemannella flava]|uniref:Protein kinase domain-containing protein n=1 Tax=Luedemannella flava TaxID=349316 RepID=A0ABN2LVR4_9ACTN
MTRLRGQVWYGLVRCCVVVPLWLLLVPAVMGGRRLLVRRHRDVPAWAAALAVLAVWLGPAYVKAAQLASTRADVVPAAWCRALGRLREDGRPIRAGYVRRQLAAHGFGPDPLRLLGAGSVACVYLVADPGGTGPVAVKLLRPGVRTAIARDLAVFRFGARVTARLPRARHLPILDMIGHIADAIAGQVDLVRERENLRVLRERLDPARITVPAPRPGGSVDVLVMDHLAEFSDPQREAPPQHQRLAAESLTECVFRMLFTVGVVHCDLHPGNLRVARDGRVCIVDAGFVVTPDDVLRRQFCEFFLGLSLGNGARCARSIVDAAVTMPASLDRDLFDAEVTDIVRRYTGLPAGEFSIASFVDELFALQRRHRIFVSAAFVVPILTLLVIEGSVRTWHPDLDFQAVAQPIVLAALVRLPNPGRVRARAA